MTRRAELIAGRAKALVGTAYRPQGRGAQGLDCVGVAAFALGLPDAAVPEARRRRTATLQMLGDRLGLHGFAAVGTGEAEAGDLLAFSPGLGRLHLGIATDGAFVHADAGLGRVVERPLPPPWPLAGIWRAVAPQAPER